MSPKKAQQLTHLDANLRPTMVDVSTKVILNRTASASGFIHLKPQTLKTIFQGTTKKGNALITAEIAGICAAKKTSELIPLCHQLALSSVKVKAEPTKTGILVTAEVRCQDRTGVEMEALTAVSVSLLTLYDMLKAIDKSMVISDICLTQKTKEPVL